MKAIQAILQTIPGWNLDELVLIPLSGGITNQNFRINQGTKSFVLRIGGKNANLLGIKRSYEHAAAQIAAEVGIGPQVIWANAEEDILVTQLIEGTSMTREEAVRPDKLARIVQSIKDCHDGPPFPVKFSPFDTIRTYYHLALAQGVLFPKCIQKALQEMEWIEKNLIHLMQPKPCHNDLLAANLIDDGEKIWIIDWEYAGMGDIFFDLGNFAVNQSLEWDMCQTLLSLYFGQVQQADGYRLEQMMATSDLREALWGFLQSGISEIDFDYGAYARMHLDRFLVRTHSLNHL